MYWAKTGGASNWRPSPRTSARLRLPRGIAGTLLDCARRVGSGGSATPLFYTRATPEGKAARAFGPLFQDHDLAVVPALHCFHPVEVDTRGQGSPTVGLPVEEKVVRSRREARRVQERSNRSALDIEDPHAGRSLARRREGELARRIERIRREGRHRQLS